MDKTVLLIEDLPVIQNLYGGALSQKGYKVDLAGDGKSALELVKSNTYDFVLLDLLLPEINGIEFLEKFTDRPQQTKIIILSDFDEPKTRDRARQLNTQAYLIKSENTPSQLLEKLTKFK